MQRIEGPEFKKIEQYFRQAADVARTATCHKAHCGAVIVNDDTVLATGANSPAGGLESQRLCDATMNTMERPKYDKTCCVHAEWQAILRATQAHPKQIIGSTLYFMRIDTDGEFTDAGLPFCTVCSRLSLESGVRYFALYNDGGMDLYDTEEYNLRSYADYSTSPKVKN
mgnify:CR=1 FL=1|tara:strand:+ start:2613 stop:3119 length:507 start_codon:yes stop_codon:yes gene_type:complete